MGTQDATLTFNEESVLELLKAHVQRQYASADVLQRKAQFNFTTVNVLAAIVAGFSIEIGGASASTVAAATRVIIIVIMGIIYCWVAYLSLKALGVRNYASLPMDPTKSTIEEWTKCTPNHHKEILIESYRNIYESNQKIATAIGRRVSCSHRLILVGIVLFIVQALVAVEPVGKVMEDLFASVVGI